jgi:hypothetical protein
MYLWKNKPKNKPGHVVENKRWLKIVPRTSQGPRTPQIARFQAPPSEETLVQ